MIGEMFDLEKLCQRADELGRYTCFVSSVPLKVSSGLVLDRVPTAGFLRIRLTIAIGTGRRCKSTECNRDILRAT